MNVRYLVDTDWVVDFLNDAPVVTDRVRNLIRGLKLESAKQPG